MGLAGAAAELDEAGNIIAAASRVPARIIVFFVFFIFVVSFVLPTPELTRSADSGFQETYGIFQEVTFFQ